jgi:hypothetical protein
VKVFKTRRAFYIWPVLFSVKSVVPPRQAPSGRPREFHRPLAGMVNKGSSTSAVWTPRVIRGASGKTRRRKRKRACWSHERFFCIHILPSQDFTWTPADVANGQAEFPRWKIARQSISISARIQFLLWITVGFIRSGATGLAFIDEDFACQYNFELIPPRELSDQLTQALAPSR